MRFELRRIVRYDSTRVGGKIPRAQHAAIFEMIEDGSGRICGREEGV